MPNPTRKTVEGDCRRCGMHFVAGAQGSQQIYCGRDCRYASQIERKIEKKKQFARERREAGYYRCQWEGCGLVLESGTKWCEVHAKESRRQAPKHSTTTFCTEAGCERFRMARGFCSMHWKRWARSEGMIKDAPWDDRRRDNYHKRRARAKGADYGARAFLGDVIERDGTDCSLCGEVVDMSVAWPDPLSKSIDHVVPLSKGGAHELSNCRLAHLGCNVRKGNRAA